MPVLACVTLVNMDPSIEQARQAFVAGIEQFERHEFEAACDLFEKALRHAPGRPWRTTPSWPRPGASWPMCSATWGRLRRQSRATSGR
jgi:hypothetical protein